MREKAICTTNCFDSVLFFLRSFRSCILCCVGSNIEANSYWNIGSIVMMMVYYVLCGAESLWGALEKHTLIRHMLHSFVSLLALRQHLRGCAQNESAFVTQFLIPGITSHLASFFFLFWFVPLLRYDQQCKQSRVVHAEHDQRKSTRSEKTPAHSLCIQSALLVFAIHTCYYICLKVNDWTDKKERMLELTKRQE